MERAIDMFIATNHLRTLPNDAPLLWVFFVPQFFDGLLREVGCPV